jgi:hexosaminidase
LIVESLKRVFDQVNGYMSQQGAQPSENGTI